MAAACYMICQTIGYSAFQLIGNITAVLVYCTYQLMKMVEQNVYGRCLMTDFTKMFDSA